MRQGKGFTVVELLIVIVVIGILATLTVIAYRGVQDSANNAAVQSDLENIGKQLMAYNARNGSYPSNPFTLGVKAAKGSYLTTRNNFYFCINSSTNQYAVSAISKSGQGYQNVNGVVSTSASQLWSADTCNLITSGTPSGGFDQSGGTGWQSWVGE